MPGYKRLGELMADKGLLSDAQMAFVLERKATSPLRFGEIVVQLGYATETEVAECLAEQYDYPIVHPREIDVDPQAIELIPAVFALRRGVLAYKLTDREIFCAISDPLDLSTSDEVAVATGRTVQLAIATDSELQKAIALAYALPESVIAKPIEFKVRRTLQGQPDREALLHELDVRLFDRRAA